MFRVFAALAAALVLAGCYTTTTRIVDPEAAEAWEALPGRYDVTISADGVEAQRKTWTFSAAEDGATPAYRFHEAGARPAETLVQILYGDVRLLQVADARGKFLLMVARPTATGFEALLHDDVAALAARHGVEAVALDIGYQLNGPAAGIRALLADTANRPARVFAAAVKRP